ncbi:MAG TPA: class I SAM-dependent methyltransferase [Vicinamibacterales bacterium]|jgi:2-polyprenyl-3-methyl-5-hydroxy-6-metoxy-1,4-benzoquinol methylase|nr:class I SAM-dependent methyltransferase [Vicinamibacterales bacterium]
MRGTWNANTHYHAVVLAALPSGASRVLDVGCGDGMLSADLVDAGVRQVVGLDADQPVLDRARALHEGKGIQWVRGNVLEVAFGLESFDGVVCVAALHHMDARQALMRFAQLVRPGGTVAVVGLAAYSWLDVPLVGVAVVSKLALRLLYGRRRSSAPKRWPPL